MKKIWVALLSFIMSIAFCFGLTACDPAQVVNELTNEIGAMIEGGGFLEGSELNFESVTEEQAEEIIAQLESRGIALDDTTKAYIYDIFVTKGDKEVQPDGEVTVTVPAPEDENAVGYNVYHVKDSGAVESLPSTYEDGKIKFKTDGFSYYVITATYNCITYEFTHGVRINTSAINNGTVSVNGETLSTSYNESWYVGSTLSLTATPNAGYEVYCWFIDGKQTITEFGESITYTVGDEDVEIRVVFKPIITSLALTHFDDTFEYDLTQTVDAQCITIEQYYNETVMGEFYLVAGVLEYVYGNGTVVIKDEHANEVQAKFAEGAFSNETYRLLVGKKNKFVALYGRKDDVNFKMTDATLKSFVPDFSKEQIKGVSVEGSAVLSEGDYYTEGDKDGDIDWTTPGEYVVTYYLASNPEIYKTVTISVIGKQVTFDAWVNNGTILIEGADIGPDYREIFKYGHGKVTLTAKGDENTVFSGWKLIVDNDNILISKETTYTFEFSKDTVVWSEFEYVASEITLDGANSGFDTFNGVTDIYLPAEDRTFNLEQIGVYAIINEKRVPLTLDDYTIDADGFDGTNPKQGIYEITFTYKANPEVKATHLIHVFGEGGAVNVDVSVDAGGRLARELKFYQYNVGEQVTLEVELRSETDYEFLGWYSVVYGVTEASSSETLLSTDKTYVHTVSEYVCIRAKIEPKITYLEVGGYEGNPTRVNVTKFWMDTREFTVYGCGALGKREQLEESEYTVDWGGLDLNNPVVGKYVITYTYNENPDIKCEITVFVWEKDYLFTAVPNSPNFGYIIFENKITTEAVNTFVEGEEVSVTAIANDGLTFMGWYEVIPHDTYNEYVLISLEQNYTFIIDKDITLEAKFDAPVTSISLDGVFMNNDGSYYIDVTEGDSVDLSVISVVASSLMGDTMLGEDEYDVEYDGLDVANPTYGSYTLVYTYGDTDITTTLVVNVFKRTHLINVSASGGQFEFEGVERGVLSQYFDEDSVLILKAGEYNSQNRAFLGWYEYDVENGGWEALSTDESVAITVNGDRRIRCKFGYATTNIEVYDNYAIYEKGVNYFYIDSNTTYDEITGKYVTYGCIDLLISSEYADNLEKLFSDANIFVKKYDGSWSKVNANDIVLDLGSYKPENGWYTIVLKYGTLVVNIDVYVY